MGRKRCYANAAERQRAFRERAKSANTEAQPVVPPVKTRKLSRPKRLMALEDGIRHLLDEYEEWRAQLPETLEGTAQADALDVAIETLGEAAELLAGISPPRGFGRD